MRRKEKMMNHEAIMSLVKRENVLRLGLSLDNQPYIVPLNYGFADNSFYIHCALEGKKLDYLKANNKVCIEIEGQSSLVTGDEACQYTMKFESVMGFGKAYILTGQEEVKKGLDVLMAQFSDQTFTYHEKAMSKVAIIRIDIESLTGKASI